MRSPRELLDQTRTIALVGYSDNPSRVSNRIAGYLRSQGYKVYPVNPTLQETDSGERCYPTVASIPEKIDLVNVFRRPEYIPEVVDDAIAAGAGAIWLQLGITNPEAEERAGQAGLDVVSDQCIMVDHRMYGIARKSA